MNKTLNNEITAKKLHEFYLGACEDLTGESYNSLAQKQYNNLTEDQKWIDKYIAQKVNELIKKHLKKLKEDLNKELYLKFKNGFDMTDTINWINKFDIEESIDKIFKENLGELE